MTPPTENKRNSGRSTKGWLSILTLLCAQHTHTHTHSQQSSQNIREKYKL